MKLVHSVKHTSKKHKPKANLKTVYVLHIRHQEYSVFSLRHNPLKFEILQSVLHKFSKKHNLIQYETR